MARARILKRGDNRYLELPEGLLSYDELELFELREGYYLLSVPLGVQKNPQKKGVKLDSDEAAVLQKLLRIRFEKRIPAYVNKALNEQELKVLLGLEKKGFVNVFRGRKYKDGVYSIRDDVYPLVNGRPAPQKQATAPKQTSPYGTLMEKGFLVLGNKNEAMEFSERTKMEMKKGTIKGVKGFDGKFYAVTSNYLAKASAIILKSLDKDMDLETIAKQTNLDREGCCAVLRLLSESGDVIEKKKGMFASV